jgi:hypothetical protein
MANERDEPSTKSKTGPLGGSEALLSEVGLPAGSTIQSVQRRFGVNTSNAMRLLALREAVLAVLLPGVAHRCSGCGHRWNGDLKGAELCGDCWRKVQPAAHGEPPAPAPSTCQECCCQTGGGDYCYEHAPYTVWPLKDGTRRELRNGQTTHVGEPPAPARDGK